MAKLLTFPSLEIKLDAWEKSRKVERQFARAFALSEAQKAIDRNPIPESWRAFVSQRKAERD